METNPSSLILALDALYGAAATSQLSLTGFDALSEELATVTAAFRVSPPEAILLSVVVGESNLERTTVKQLAAYVERVLRSFIVLLFFWSVRWAIEVFEEYDI